MIDREARNKLAKLLMHFTKGRITNYAFENNRLHSDDLAVSAIFQSASLLYDNSREHYLKREDNFSKEDFLHITRWIMFLYSDFEYQWPKYDLTEMYNWPMNILTLGLWEKVKEKKYEKFMAHGKFDVWPFIAKKDFIGMLDQMQEYKDRKAEES